MRTIRWGIIGLGNIANRFGKTVKAMDSVELVAVASRSKEKAEEFGRSYHIPGGKCYGSYEELVKDKDVDAIYIAVPHPFHKELSILCLNHGKAVLCEKPVTMNGDEIQEVIAVARAKKIFFMEAMKTRFLPINETVKNLIKNGAIGEVKLLQADFGFKSGVDPNNRFYNKELGGGALLDVGIYTLSYGTYLLGNNPIDIRSNMFIGKTEVDENVEISLTYENGVQAQLYSSITLPTRREANIIGTEGRICVPIFSNADTAYIIKDGKEEKIHRPHEITGFEYQIKEVVKCINEGKLESDIMSWNDSIETMRILDRVRNNK